VGGGPSDLASFVREDARRLGFEAVRITSADAIPDAPRWLEAWVEAGHHADMSWMAETMERRASPRVLWSEVRSIIMLGMNYGPAMDPLAHIGAEGIGVISVYARGRDYHDVIKGRLKELAGRFAARAGADVKVFVDTAPVMEKPLAAASGMGWQGKHSALVSRDFGNWLFLGVIFTTAELPFDTPQRDLCGSCRKCLDACPTDAFPEPYVVDARRCISYLTIEHKGPIPEDLREGIGNRIYGCDDCLAVCPWNKFASAGREMKLAAREELNAPRLYDLLSLDDARFRQFFAGSPIKRIGRDRFIRNVLIAVGNTRDLSSRERTQELLHDPSPLVRGMAVWALARLIDPSDLSALAAPALAFEDDADVRQEWHNALIGRG
jgi:epoxyqueuosine reductase